VANEGSCALRSIGSDQGRYEIVSTLRVALAGKVGQERFDLWFGAGTRLDYDGRALRIAAPNRFFLEWIRANFRRHIETACCDVFGACRRLNFTSRRHRPKRR